MARRKNILGESELAILEKETKSYVKIFREAIDLFVKDCELRNLRPHTIQYYMNEFKAFLSALSDQGIDITVLKPYSMTEEHIKENVILYMKNYKGNKIVSINTRLRGLRAFFNFLFKHKHIPKNPMENIKLLKDRKTVIATFTKEHLKKLFRQPDLKTFTGVRDYTIIYDDLKSEETPDIKEAKRIFSNHPRTLTFKNNLIEESSQKLIKARNLIDEIEEKISPEITLKELAYYKKELFKARIDVVSLKNNK